MARLTTVLLCMGALCATDAYAQNRIAAGETVSGALTRRDSHMDNGAHFDLWTYSGQRGERITVTLRSIQFDAYVMVQPFPGGGSRILARDDDSGEGQDARVTVTLPEDGDYIITATSVERNETGAYRLSVQSSRTAARVLGRAIAAGAVAEKPRPETKAATVTAKLLVPGQTVAAALTSEERAPLGAAEGDWRFTGRRGETVTIDMRSSEFDPHLALYSVNGQSVVRVAEDDNGGGGLNARVVYSLPADGEYLVRAERRRPGRSGSYTLAFQSRTRLGRVAQAAEAARLIPANAAISSELDRSDAKMHDGTPYELWSYIGRAGESLRITLRSDDFDAFLSIGTVANGVFTAIESADDGAGGTDSRLEIILPFAGEYAIRANSLSPKRPTGDYILRIDSLR